MALYHEITPNSLASVRTEGLSCTSSGAKSQDDAIIKTNELLDAYRPDHVKSADLSRCNNLYGYLGDDTSLLDIKDGQRISLEEKKHQTGLILLRLDVDAACCWVSDLDKYDAVKDALLHDRPRSTIHALSKTYWNSVEQLATYSGTIKRPEIMITQNVKPADIHEA